MGLPNPKCPICDKPYVASADLPYEPDIKSCVACIVADRDRLRTAARPAADALTIFAKKCWPQFDTQQIKLIEAIRDALETALGKDES